MVLAEMRQQPFLALLETTTALWEAPLVFLFRVAVGGVVPVGRQTALLVQVEGPLLLARAVVALAGKRVWMFMVMVDLVAHRGTFWVVPEVLQAARSTAPMAPTPCALHPAPVVVAGLLTQRRQRPVMAEEVERREVVEAAVVAV